MEVQINMFKKLRFYIASLFILFNLNVYGTEFIDPMSLYKDNYFICGDSLAQVKLQFSAKYNIFWPSQTGLYLGYTQTSKWVCYEKKDTFYTAYQPEIFYVFESGNNLFNNAVIPFIDYIQVSPFNHISNGTEGSLHRGMNLYYGQIQLSYGEVFNIGINFKGFGYYSYSAKNKDIKDYKGHTETGIFIKLRSKNVYLLDKEEIWFKFGGYRKSPDLVDPEKSVRRGWYCIEGRFRILTSYIQPRLFISYYKGYNEILQDYNKDTKSVRVGLVF